MRDQSSGQTERESFVFSRRILSCISKVDDSNKRAPTPQLGRTRYEFGSPVPREGGGDKTSCRRSTVRQHTTPQSQEMAETSSSEEEAPLVAAAAELSASEETSEEAREGEAEGERELERRTKAVEQALSPLIQQVSF